VTLWGEVVESRGGIGRAERDTQCDHVQAVMTSGYYWCVLLDHATIISYNGGMAY
jgi:hypothetical protein